MMTKDEKLKDIENQIRLVMKNLEIDHLPSYMDIEAYSVTLRNQIGSTGGMTYWAIRLGLKTYKEIMKNKNKAKTEKPVLLSEADRKRNEEKERANKKYFEQCKPGEVVKKKLSETELAKYREIPDQHDRIPSMLNIDNLVRKDHETDRDTIQAFHIKNQLQGGEEKMAKEKALSISTMELTGKVLSYKIQGDSFSISNKKTGINVELKDIDALIQELQELKGVVANG